MNVMKKMFKTWYIIFWSNFCVMHVFIGYRFQSNPQLIYQCRKQGIYFEWAAILNSWNLAWQIIVTCLNKKHKKTPPTMWKTIFFKHSPKWRVDWNKYSPNLNRARHVWRVTFFWKLANKYQINNSVMFNNLFCRFWHVINLVKKDQHSLKSCIDLFFIHFVFFVF